MIPKVYDAPIVVPQIVPTEGDEDKEEAEDQELDPFRTEKVLLFQCGDATDKKHTFGSRMAQIGNFLLGPLSKQAKYTLTNDDMEKDGGVDKIKETVYQNNTTNRAYYLNWGTRIADQQRPWYRQQQSSYVQIFEGLYPLCHAGLIYPAVYLKFRRSQRSATRKIVYEDGKIADVVSLIETTLKYEYEKDGDTAVRYDEVHDTWLNTINFIANQVVLIGIRKSKFAAGSTTRSFRQRGRTTKSQRTAPRTESGRS
jgi:hypothetical protein